MRFLSLLLVAVFLFTSSISTFANTITPSNNNQEALNTELTSEQIKSINKKLLNLVLNGRENEIDNLAEVKAIKEKFEANPEIASNFIKNINALDKNQKPIRTITYVQINGVNSEIKIYSDGSFSVNSVTTKKKINNTEKIIPTLGEELVSETITGYGDYTNTVKTMFILVT